MAESIDTSDTLMIRCPNCRLRFPVGHDLMNRLVECGGCEASFLISNEVILRSKRYHRGDRADADLDQFQRMPHPAPSAEKLRSPSLKVPKHMGQPGTTSPQRLIAGFVGVVVMLLTGLILLLGAYPGGPFRVMPLENKLIIAGFVSLLGLFLLLYSSPTARLRAGFVGLMIGAAIVSIPFFFKGQPISGGKRTKIEQKTVVQAPREEDVDPIVELRARLGTQPLEVERDRLRRAGSDKSAYGVYLTNLLTQNKYTTRDFLIRDTGAAFSSHPYPRDEGNFLMILTEVSLEIEEVAKIAGRLGVTEEIHPEIGVIVVRVDNEHFNEVATEELNNQNDPAFYKANMDELTSIDNDRVKRAVSRLADAKPELYRADITRTMIELLRKPSVSFSDDLAKALLVWAEDPTAASVAGLEALRRSVDAGDVISENVVNLVTKAGSEDAVPIINKMWSEDPTAWEKYYLRLGERILPGLLAQLHSEDMILRRSAVRLLGSVGTDQEIPKLKQLSDDEDPEIRVLTARSIAEINER